MSLAVVLSFMGWPCWACPSPFAMGVAAVAGAVGHRRRLLDGAHPHDACGQFVPADVDPVLHARRRADDQGRHRRAADRPGQHAGRARARRPGARHHAGRRMGLATVSGAAVSDASALSSILVPSLRKVYDKGFATAIVAAAANLGPIIPPSGRDDRLRLHGRLVGLGGRHVHGRRGARAHHGRLHRCCARGSPAGAAGRSPATLPAVAWATS
jgi:hypothetical protein